MTQKNRKKNGFLGILPDTLGPTLLADMLNEMKEKGMIRVS